MTVKIVTINRKRTFTRVWSVHWWSVSPAPWRTVGARSQTSRSSPCSSTPLTKLKAGTWRRTCSGTVHRPVRPTPRTPGTSPATNLQVGDESCKVYSFYLYNFCFFITWNNPHVFFFQISNKRLCGRDSSWFNGGPASAREVAPPECGRWQRVPRRALSRAAFYSAS